MIVGVPVDDKHLGESRRNQCWLCRRWRHNRLDRWLLGRAGRLVAPDEGAHPDEETDEIATDVGRAGYASSAEEAAVHIRDEDDTARD